MTKDGIQIMNNQQEILNNEGKIQIRNNQTLHPLPGGAEEISYKRILFGVGIGKRHFEMNKEHQLKNDHSNKEY